ncbi:MAG: hypothetical protein ACJASM_002043 [Salibacteraceae bacterium]|jgi:hypothetical protein
MSDEIVRFDAPELQGIESSKAEQIKATFEPMAKMLSSFEGQFEDIINEASKAVSTSLATKAKRLRLDIGRVRIETEKTRKAQKDEFLRAGKAIDGVSNILKWAITDKEEKLKEIENHFEIQEKKKLEALQLEREELLSDYVDDAHLRDLSGMQLDVWDAYLSTKKQDHVDRIAAEKKAEEERQAKIKAEEEENERVRKENEKLKSEAEEKERLEKIEKDKRKKEESDRKAKEESEKKAREEKERKDREAHEAELKIAKDKSDAIEQKLKAKEEAGQKEKAKEEADQKAKEDAEKARIQYELSKGDEEKVKDLILDLKSLKEKYYFNSASSIKMYTDTCGLIDKIVAYIEK